MKTNEIKLDDISSKEMSNLILIINADYLLGIPANERTLLCKSLIDKIKEFPLLKAPSCWEDAYRNPGVWNTWAEEKYGIDFSTNTVK